MKADFHSGTAPCFRSLQCDVQGPALFSVATAGPHNPALNGRRLEAVLC